MCSVCVGVFVGAHVLMCVYVYVQGRDTMSVPGSIVMNTNVGTETTSASALFITHPRASDKGPKGREGIEGGEVRVGKRG